MRYLYKSTKVVYDAHMKQYEVYYKNWFSWVFDSYYRYDENPRHPVHYCSKERAEQRAIERAGNMLKTHEVWRQSNFFV